MKFSLAFILSFFILSCSSPNKNGEEQFTIKVTDFRQKEIRLKKPAKRVICLIESGLSGIYMLQKQENLVGIPSNVYQENLHRYYAQLDNRIAKKTLPTPGNWDFVSIEQIVGLKPDLVIIWASQTEAIDNLENFDIPVYAVMLKSFDDVYKEIRDFGIFLNAEKKAEELIQHSKSELQQIRNSNSNSNRHSKSVYFMWAQNITETSGKNSTVQELLTAAGTKNVCPLDAEHVSISVEKIHDWNPDIIVMWYNEKLNPEDIIKNPLLQGISAIKNKKVFELPESFECDFWTLKMEHPARLINHWAYHDTPIDKKELFNKTFFSLYGKKITHE